MNTLSKVIGFSLIDELISPIRSDWSVELYGDELLINYFFHVTLAYNSVWRRVFVIVAKEFGGIDPALLVKLCRIHGCSLNGVQVVRAFRNEDLVEILGELKQRSGELVVTLYPYSYLPKDPESYWKATLITGLLHQLSLRNQVIVFNAESKFGKYMPEGGSMHHHVVKVIVKLWRSRDVCYAKLIKHPCKEGGVRVFRAKILEENLFKAPRSLLNWV